MNNNSVTNLYDVLKNLIQYGMPVFGTIIGIFLGKWWEGKNENKKLKREVYLKANRALKRYSNFYMTICAYPDDKKSVQLTQEGTLLEEVRADLEIFGSNEACNVFANVLQLAVACGREALQKSNKGEALKDPARDISKYSEYLVSLQKWNNTARKDLKAK